MNNYITKYYQSQIKNHNDIGDKTFPWINEESVDFWRHNRMNMIIDCLLKIKNGSL